MGDGLWAMGYALWTMGYGLWAMGYTCIQNAYEILRRGVHLHPYFHQVHLNLNLHLHLRSLSIVTENHPKSVRNQKISKNQA